jgi:methylmalonyl-CoA/ethylmalonyl-CoA epimerase
MPVKRVDHIAIVIPDLEEAQTFYRDALGLEVSHIELVEDQEVTVAFLPTGGAEIELLEPTNDTSGVAKFLHNRGPGIHHICLEVDDIEATLARMKAQGAQLINEEPVTGSGGKQIAFAHPKSTYGVLIELVEKPTVKPKSIVRTLSNFRTRLGTERQAVSAGLAAFIKGLRGQDEPAGRGQGITLKAEGEMPDEDL